MTGSGAALTVTETGALLPLHPPELVPVTKYVPLFFTTIDCVESPVLQPYLLRPLVADSVMLSPKQRVVGPLAVTITDGFGTTVIASGVLVPEQPTVFVELTVIVSVFDTKIVGALSPVDH